MVDELERIWKQLWPNRGSTPPFAGGPEEKTKSLSGYPVSRPRFEPSTSRI
jgi:hypothetical protein